MLRKEWALWFVADLIALAFVFCYDCFINQYIAACGYSHVLFGTRHVTE